MAILRKFSRFGFSSNPAPKAMLSRMKSTLDRHSDYLESIVGEDGIEIRRNAMGGITIGADFETTGSGAWSGFVWWLGAIKWDFSRISAAPDGETLADGIAVEGVYLKVKLIDGSTAWADAIGTDVDEYNYYPVGVRSGEEGSYVYSLTTGRVVGDIRIDFVPFHAPLEDEAEE